MSAWICSLCFHPLPGLAVVVLAMLLLSIGAVVGALWRGLWIEAGRLAGDIATDDDVLRETFRAGADADLAAELVDDLIDSVISDTIRTRQAQPSGRSIDPDPRTRRLRDLIVTALSGAPKAR